MAGAEILGVRFDKIDGEAALAQIPIFIAGNKPHLIVTANPETVMAAQGDQLLAEILRRADLVVADGIGVIWAGRALGSPLPERIPGIELAEGILRQAAEKGWRVFFLGGAEGVAPQAAENMRRVYPALNVVGTYHGYFQDREEKALLEKIKSLRPQVLLAALGMPKQEKWLAAHLAALEIPVGIGVGGSFDIWAGVGQRAPEWVRQIHLEWLYRLIKEPRRIGRMAVLPKFVWAIAAERLRRRCRWRG
ncbi:MAG: WecB/TagA/CpsF family glycosyltransferase [Firmicutes bacterium]|nr:WecB/TagA/CpsF family glycosyltransferase [Bacillota bacterium]